MAEHFATRLDFGFPGHGRVTIRTLISLLLWMGGLLVLGVAGTFYLVITVIIPPRRLHPLLRLICRLILLASGQILRVQGSWPQREGGPYIYIFNHASMFDVFAVIATVPEHCCAVGKMQQFDWPFWSWILQRYGVVPINREALVPAIESMRLVEESVRTGRSMVIAPEGTRTLTGEMGPFKKGAFHVARNTGATILPMGFHGTFEAKRKSGWLIRPGVIRAHIGEPIPQSRYVGMSIDELSNFARAQVLRLAGK